jgi:cerevisin
MQYYYPDTAGEGVDVYVVDTGVNIEHEDFEGRAKWGATTVPNDRDVDGNGHGTHVASTIAGKAHGVAKKAQIIAVKVLSSSGYGSTASVMGGISFSAKEHKRKSDDAARRGGQKVKSVGNMSLGGGKSTALDNAVERAIAAGVLFAVAAGNDGRDACDYSPAGAPSALTVGATTKFDTRSYFSNIGACVDIFAPGSDITAAWIGGKTTIKTISGTSMASPHVAGVMALVAADGDYTPKELKNKVLALATRDVVKNVGKGSPNLLLFNGNPDEDILKADSGMRFQI